MSPISCRLGLSSSSDSPGTARSRNTPLLCGCIAMKFLCRFHSAQLTFNVGFRSENVNLELNIFQNQLVKGQDKPKVEFAKRLRFVIWKSSCIFSESEWTRAALATL